MTQKEFAYVFNKLSVAYRYGFVMSVTDSADTKNEVLSVSYEYFKDYDFKQFDIAVDKYIQDMSATPSIADLIKAYRVAKQYMPVEVEEEISEEERIKQLLAEGVTFIT